MTRPRYADIFREPDGSLRLVEYPDLATYNAHPVCKDTAACHHPHNGWLWIDHYRNDREVGGTWDIYKMDPAQQALVLAVLGWKEEPADD